MDEKKRKLTVALLAISVMFSQCCNSLMAPFFPIEAAKKGTSETIISIIFSSAEFTVFITSPIFGSLMAYVNPRFMYVAGLCVYGLCDIMFGFLNKSPSGTPYIAICFATRIIEATGTAALMTSSYVIGGSLYPDRVNTVYSLIQSASGIGFTIGPAVGGVLYQGSGIILLSFVQNIHHIHLLTFLSAKLGSFGLPFWILGSCVFLCGWLNMILMPQVNAAAPESRGNSLYLLKSPRVCYALFSIICYSVSVTCFYPTFSPELAKFEVGPAVTGIVMILPAIVFALTVPVWGLILDRLKNPLPVTVFGFAGFFVTLMLFGPAPFLTFIPSTLWLHVVCCTCLGLFSSPTWGSSFKTFTIGTRNLGLPDDSATYGLMAGLMQASMCCGSFLGPLLGGILADNYGFAWSEAIVGFICLVPLFIGCVGLCVKETKHNNNDEKTPLLHNSDPKEHSAEIYNDLSTEV